MSLEPVSLAAVPPRRSRGHVQPRTPRISLDQQGLLRTGDVLGLVSISHSTLHQRIKDGAFPKPDGNDGRNFWFTATIKAFLERLAGGG
jgi:predicted DNA-binding transcriptional regulator AlpA